MLGNDRSKARQRWRTRPARRGVYFPLYGPAMSACRSSEPLVFKRRESGSETPGPAGRPASLLGVATSDKYDKHGGETNCS